MTKSRTRAVSILSIVLLALAAIGPLSGTVSAQDDRPVLVHATNAGDKATFDPHLASGTQDRTVVDMIFNGLLRFKPGDASVIEPDLALEVPEPVAEADGTQSWTFKLRTDATCHASSATDAYPLTADDVVFSFQKAANPDTSGVSGDYAGFTFEKVDDATVKVTVPEPLDRQCSCRSSPTTQVDTSSASKRMTLWALTDSPMSRSEQVRSSSLHIRHKRAPCSWRMTTTFAERRSLAESKCDISQTTRLANSGCSLVSSMSPMVYLKPSGSTASTRWMVLLLTCSAPVRRSGSISTPPTNT